MSNWRPLEDFFPKMHQSKENYLEALVHVITNRDNKDAIEAANTFRELGWLTDGTLAKADLSENMALLFKADLNHADLHETNLAKADLRKANLTYALLSGANLPNAILNSANLTYADLKGANLTHANLSGANLTNADLSGANLTKANLVSANLTDAILNETDLFQADLNGTVMYRTQLHEANLTEAVLRGTVLADVDLSVVKGLEITRHLAPSHISTSTLYKSKGKIPITFLQGCGLPDDFIEYMLPLVGKVIQFYSCFISYSHTQKEFARRLHDRLQGAGIRCWLDEYQMKPGQDIYAEVNRGIRLWDKVLLCCSEEALTSWWVDNEIGTALEKEQQLTKERGKKIHSIIPLNLDGYLFSGNWQSGYESQIRRRLAADFTNWKDHDAFEVAFQKVLTALRTDEGREEPPIRRL